MSETRALSPVVALAVAGAVLLSVAAVFWPTFQGMVSIWGQSDTFSYGYLVLPMAFWSLWQSSRRLGDVTWQPSWLGLAAVIPAAAAWYVGEAVGVQAVAQYGMMGIFVAGCWAVLGNAAASQLRFGLGFTLFAVPVGEFMIPWLMDITADFTVAGVHMTGIPVYRTERFFTLPSGNFEVVEACSGIRFLMVTIVLATWHAQQTYASLWRKLAFIAMAGVLMTMANGLRAFIIVLLVHYSEGRIAVGYDHIVYGWIVFIVGVVLIVKLGNLFRGPGFEPRPPGGSLRLDRAARVSGTAAILFAALIGVRAGEAAIAANSASQPLKSLLTPSAEHGWAGPAEARLGFAPAFQSPDQAISVRYEGAAGEIEVHQFKYGAGSEIIRYENRLYDSEAWRLVESGQSEVELANARPLSLTRRVIERDGERLMVLSWFDIGGRATRSRIKAKWYSALREIAGGEPSDVMFAVVMATDDTHDDAALAQFVAAHYDALRHCARGRSDAARCTGAETAQVSR